MKTNVCARFVMLLRRLFRAVMSFLVHTLLRLQVLDQQNIPLTGGCIIAANHLSMVDGPLVFSLVRHHNLSAFAADKYRSNLFFRMIVELAGGIWLNREDADPKALRAALEHLKQGGGLGIAPEGTRSRTQGLIQAKTGAAYLADKAQVSVVPVAIWGTESVVSGLKRLRRPPVTIRFGKAFSLAPVERRTRDADLRRNSDEIMCQIAAMLPEQYHGVYAGHPRLVELLTQEDAPAR